MIRLISLISFCVVLALFTACANPADSAPKAVVSEAASPAASSAATQGTKLSFAADASTIDFVGSKVTGIENGSFK